MSSSQTVFVVDDEAAVRKALKLMLQAAGYEVELFESALAFLKDYDSSVPGCLILDVRMPGMDGMELLERLSESDIFIPVIILTAHGDIPMAVDAIKIGAIEFFEKPADANILREKVADALAIDTKWRQGEEEREEIRQRHNNLTPREREVVELMVDGKTSRTIATVLGTAQNTVRVQRASIMKKMQADSPGDLIKMMAQMRGIDLDSK